MQRSCFPSLANADLSVRDAPPKVSKEPNESPITPSHPLSAIFYQAVRLALEHGIKGVDGGSGVRAVT